MHSQLRTVRGMRRAAASLDAGADRLPSALARLLRWWAGRIEDCALEEQEMHIKAVTGHQVSLSRAPGRPSSDNDPARLNGLPPRIDAGACLDGERGTSTKGRAADRSGQRLT